LAGAFEIFAYLSKRGTHQAPYILYFGGDGFKPCVIFSECRNKERMDLAFSRGPGKTRSLRLLSALSVASQWLVTQLLFMG
jgi:hypothetical protein